MVNDALLTLLRWGLVGLLYLFFFRVLQVTWAGSRAALPQKRRRGSPAGAKPGWQPGAVPTLVGLEPADLAGREFPVSGELTFGRSSSARVTLDDAYLSQVHVRVSLQEQGVIIEDLGSTNGTYLNRHRLTGPVLASPGDILQFGGIVMEMR